MTPATAPVRARLAKGISPETRARLFVALCTQEHVAPPSLEHRFDVKRKFRFDFAWPEVKVALEVEGGAFVGGRHTSGAGFLKDMEKYNLAAIAGWRVLRVVPKQLLTPATLDLVRGALDSLVPGGGAWTREGV